MDSDALRNPEEVRTCTRVLPTLVGFGNYQHLSLQNYHYQSQFTSTKQYKYHHKFWRYWSNFYHLSNFLGRTLKYYRRNWLLSAAHCLVWASFTSLC